MDVLGSLLPRMRVSPPGPAARRWVDDLAACECPALTQRRARRSEPELGPSDPIVWTRARGANVEDVDGNVYVDLSAGFGAAAVGHAHPQVSDAVAAQARRLMHALGDLQPADVKVRLLSRLCGLFPARPVRVMLGLSGSDAVEAAIKTALLYTGRPGLVAFEGGYHGLSHGPLAACGYSAGFRAPFSTQLNPHVRFASYPRSAAELQPALAAVERALAADGGAVLVEPMLGRGGVVIPPADFLPGLAELCARSGALLICDEIMTGCGRTGRMFGYEHTAVSPDLVCLGKALGGGMPVSACVGRAEVMQAWAAPGGGEALHTGTFFGHPVAAAAALATLDVIEEQRLCERATTLGTQLRQQLQALATRCSQIAQVRAVGLLVGVELHSGAHALGCMRRLLDKGYITVPAAPDARVISLTPSLCITQDQLSGFVSALEQSLQEMA